MIRSFCDLCGQNLPHPSYLYDIIDCRDRYRKYHHKHWKVCDVCHEELVLRREKVIEDLKNNLDGNTCECNHNMIEFD